MHGGHAAVAGYRAVGITSVRSYVFVLRPFYYYTVMDSAMVFDLKARCSLPNKEELTRVSYPPEQIRRCCC